MKNSDLLLFANTLWVQNGGTHGCPVDPLLLRCAEIAIDEAPPGKARLRRPIVPHPTAGRTRA